MRTSVIVFLFLSVFAFSACRPNSSVDREWPSYQGSDDRNQYSESNQTTPENVNELEVAWVYRAGQSYKRGALRVLAELISVVGGGSAVVFFRNQFARSPLFVISVLGNLRSPAS
jgi:NAD kinase